MPLFLGLNLDLENSIMLDNAITYDKIAHGSIQLNS